MKPKRAEQVSAGGKVHLELLTWEAQSVKPTYPVYMSCPVSFYGSRDTFGATAFKLRFVLKCNFNTKRKCAESFSGGNAMEESYVRMYVNMEGDMQWNMKAGGEQ